MNLVNLNHFHQRKINMELMKNLKIWLKRLKISSRKMITEIRNGNIKRKIKKLKIDHH